MSQEDKEFVSYEVSPEDREAFAQLLVEAGVSFCFDGQDFVVDPDDEATVDGLWGEHPED